MTFRVTSIKRKITLKAPINLVCLVLGIAANKTMNDGGKEKFDREQRKKLVKSLRQAKADFRELVLAEINTKDGKTITITL